MTSSLLDRAAVLRRDALALLADVRGADLDGAAIVVLTDDLDAACSALLGAIAKVRGTSPALERALLGTEGA